MSQKHKFASLLRLCLLASLAWSQNPNSQGAPVSSTIFALPVTTLNAVPVSGANLQLVGAHGQTGYCYWAVANFQVGALMSSLGCVSNAANTLSSSNYVAIYPFSYPPGATVDILRTGNTFTAPSGACNCAVATGLTGGSTNDQSNSLSSYTVSIIDPNHYALTITNEVISTGISHALLRQGWPWPGTLVCDLSTGCGSGTGSVTSFSAGNLVPLFTTSVATATTTPALSFSLSTAAPNTVFGNPTGSTAAPIYFTPDLPCEDGITGGLSAMAAGTYVQSSCFNNSGITLTITGIFCHTNNSGTSTLSVADNLGNALLTGPITCAPSFVAGTQSAHITILNHGYITFTFVGDGTTVETKWHVDL